MGNKNEKSTYRILETFTLGGYWKGKMKNFLIAGLLLFFISSTLGGAVINTDLTEPAEQQTDYAIVILKDNPVASYTGGITGLKPTKPEKGHKIDLKKPEVKAYINHLENTHRNYRSFIAKNAPKAEVISDYSIVANGLAIKLNGENIEKLSKYPGVRSVTYSTRYSLAMNVSPGLINAPELWAKAGGPSNAGNGVKVGIIDSGIDLTSPFLNDTDYAAAGQTDECAPFTKSGGKNTNNKVIVCRVYASGVTPGASSPSTLIINPHGTHVAGTVAGNYGTSGKVEGTQLVVNYLSGVAPGALLGDYNVFPGFGAGYTGKDGDSFNHDIIRALEDSVRDGMDIDSMSLGGKVFGPNDILAETVNSVVDAGVIVVIAAGNEGPGDMTIASPGTALKAITVGASTNSHFMGFPVTLGTGESFGAAVGDFNPYLPPVLDTVFAIATPGNGCSQITGVSGNIAFIYRGTCTFTTKIRNAQDAGAIGVIMINNVAGDPVAMGHDGTLPKPTIPAAMVSKSDGEFIKTKSGTTNMSVNGTEPEEFITGNADIMAGFSSQGPTPFNFMLKPDITAPGVNVLSGIFNQEFAFYQGTSMATPHVSGAAALLRQLHPDWSPAQIKSALVNTAKRPVFSHIDGMTPAGVLARGGGRIDLAAANSIPLTIEPSSASFGRWKGNRDVNTSIYLAVKNVNTNVQSCSVDVTGPVIVNASTSNINLNQEESTTVSLVLNAGNAFQTPSGDYDGDVVFTCGSTVMKVPWWTRIDR